MFTLSERILTESGVVLMLLTGLLKILFILLIAFMNVVTIKTFIKNIKSVVFNVVSYGNRTIKLQCLCEQSILKKDIVFDIYIRW